jgi:hypothetical protein
VLPLSANILWLFWWYPFIAPILMYVDSCHSVVWAWLISVSNGTIQDRHSDHQNDSVRNRHCWIDILTVDPVNVPMPSSSSIALANPFLFPISFLWWRCSRIMPIVRGCQTTNDQVLLVTSTKCICRHNCGLLQYTNLFVIVLQFSTRRMHRMYGCQFEKAHTSSSFVWMLFSILDCIFTTVYAVDDMV